jgi:uncharacterized membrane protein YphA (DoxX/SURF4 family)
MLQSHFNLKPTMSKTKTIAYWITTILIALSLVSGGITEVIRQPYALKGMRLLGYPDYLMLILGVWKLLGAIAILAPRLPRAKEWAYAGIFFDLTGASASHTLAGDYGPGYFHVYVPLIIVVLLIASWALRPASRVLGRICCSSDGAPVSDPSAQV